MKNFLLLGDNSLLQFLTVIIIFVFVLWLTHFTTKWISNFQKTKAVGKNIESVEVFKITNNKYIQILRTGKEYIVIAVCKDTITLLNKINQEDIELMTNLSNEADSFGQVFERLKNLKQKDK